jgi:hypothetical protein
MTEEERYIHFVSCIGHLNKAWGILQDIKQNKGNRLVGPAFQFALIEYSKPYVESRGIVKAHRLGIKHVPSQYRTLHKEILTERKTIHAHSDLTVDDAKVYVANTKYGKYVGIVRNIVYDTEKLTKINDIIDLIEKSLASMSVRVRQLEAALPLNP